VKQNQKMRDFVAVGNAENVAIKRQGGKAAVTVRHARRRNYRRAPV
jgi:hypothetical protein